MVYGVGIVALVSIDTSDVIEPDRSVTFIPQLFTYLQRLEEVV